MEKHTDYAKIEKQARIRSRVRSTAVHILLSLWAVIVLFPFYWMVLTSVKSYSAYNSEYIPKVLYPLPHSAKLRRRLYGGAPRALFHQYAGIHFDHHAADAIGHNPRCFRLCPA